MNARQIFKRGAIILLLIVVSFLFKFILLGGTSVTSLGGAQPLAGNVAPSVVTPISKNVLPQEGKDFKITGTHYFDNRQWAVVKVATLPDMNSSTLVLEKQNGIYTVVLGPGTAFPVTAAESMPADVNQYLQLQRLF